VATKGGAKQIKVSAEAAAWIMKRKGARIEATGRPCSVADIVSDLILAVEGRIPRKKV
jgi:hypothetical protein